MMFYLATLFLILCTNVSQAAYSNIAAYPNISAYESKKEGSLPGIPSNLRIIEGPNSRSDEKNCVILTQNDGIFFEPSKKILLPAFTPKKLTTLSLSKKLLVSLHEELAETTKIRASSLDKTSVSTTWVLIDKDESALELIKEEEFCDYSYSPASIAITSEHCWYFQPKKRGWTRLCFAQAKINLMTKQTSDEACLAFFIYIPFTNEF